MIPHGLEHEIKLNKTLLVYNPDVPHRQRFL